MAGDKGVEVAAPHIDFAPKLAEGNSTLVPILLELSATDVKFLTYLLTGQVLIRISTYATTICLG